MNIAAILTDIEGTTSSIDFVHDVLFPYASVNLAEFVRREHEQPAIAALLDEVRQQADDSDAGLETIIAKLLQWIEEDQKVTALKALQGHLWKSGYENGEFTGHVYKDAADYMRRWADAGIPLYVYSSGSVEAQQLLFGYSDAGDLRPLFSGYFDTRVGHKRESDSYREIAMMINIPAPNILFLSDVLEELDAARDAGLQTVQLVRDDDVIVGEHRVAADFTEVLV